VLCLRAALCQLCEMRGEQGATSFAASRRDSEGCIDYLLVESTGISEPLARRGACLGRRIVFTCPLSLPPQKN